MTTTQWLLLPISIVAVGIIASYLSRVIRMIIDYLTVRSQSKQLKREIAEYPNASELPQQMLLEHVRRIENLISCQIEDGYVPAAYLTNRLLECSKIKEDGQINRDDFVSAAPGATWDPED